MRNIEIIIYYPPTIKHNFVTFEFLPPVHYRYEKMAVRHIGIRIIDLPGTSHAGREAVVFEVIHNVRRSAESVGAQQFGVCHHRPAAAYAPST